MKPKFLNIPYVVWLTVFCLIPLILTLYFSLTDDNLNFTIKNFSNVFKYSSIFLYSIYFSIISTFFCLVLGYPTSLIISTMNKKIQNIIITLITAPMWINFLLRTYSWMTILENKGILNFLLNKIGVPPLEIINTQLAVFIGLIYNSLPYMILPIYTSLTRINKNTIEAAKDLGSNKFTIFTKIIWPLSIPGVISGLMMVFIPSMSTFAISKMLGGGKIIFISELIELKFLGGASNLHSGSALAIFFVFVIMIFIGKIYNFDNDKKFN